MFHPKLLVALFGVAALSLMPVPPVIGGFGASAALAKGEKGGGDGGGGGGGGRGESAGGKGGKSDSASDRGKGASSKGAGSRSAGKSKAADGSRKSAKADKAAKARNATARADKTQRPKARDMGKMNGALHANINAVLAHIRNGNTNGPVGLLAGLAIADAAAAAGAATAQDLAGLAAAHDALTEGLAGLGFETLDQYQAAVADGTVTAEDIATLDSLIAATGGLAADGSGLATTRPDDADLAAAADAALASADSVAAAEQAILDAWNKDGDGDALLSDLRDRLVGYEADIAEAIAETADVEDSAAVEETAGTDIPAEEEIAVVAN